MTHSLRCARHSPLFDEMSLAADSDEKKLYRRLLTQSFSTIFMGKPVASRFGQMANRIQDWWILIPFGNRVYHLPRSVSFNENRPQSVKLIFKKGLKTWYPNFGLVFPTRKTGMPLIFRRSVCFRDFPLKRRKQLPETQFIMVSTAKHQSVDLLVCFKRSHIESFSSFMIHTRCHTSI